MTWDINSVFKSLSRMAERESHDFNRFPNGKVRFDKQYFDLFVKPMETDKNGYTHYIISVKCLECNTSETRYWKLRKMTDEGIMSVSVSESF
jgi:hypothetical protein